MFPVNAASWPLTLRRTGLLAAAASALALAACGGGDRAKEYQPHRIVSFGDEYSFIDGTGYTGALTLSSGGAATLKGLTYSIDLVVPYVSLVCNDPVGVQACAADDSSLTFNETGASTSYHVLNAATPNLVTRLDRSGGLLRSTEISYTCNTASIWIQTIAHNFRMGYQSACPPDDGGAVTYATPGAKVADIVNQVQAHRGELGSGVLVTLMGGQNDILEQYDLIKNSGRDVEVAKAELKQRAEQLAAAIKSILATDAKVVLALTPDLGDSPLAVANGDGDLLHDLTYAFNNHLYVNQLGSQSGRKLAGVNTPLYTNERTRPSGYNYDVPGCNSAIVTTPDGQSVTAPDDVLLHCSYLSMSSVDARALNIWADSTRFGPAAHQQIGAAAYNRAREQF